MKKTYKPKDARRYIFMYPDTNLEIINNSEITDRRIEYILKDGRRIRCVEMFNNIKREPRWFELKNTIINNRPKRIKTPIDVQDVKQLKKNLKYQINVSGRELNLGKGFEKVYFETYIVKTDIGRYKFYSKEFYLTVPNIEEIVNKLQETFEFGVVENIEEESIVGFVDELLANSTAIA